jgi:hypothetical protein
MKKPPNAHYRHRFPAELIRHAVWLYHVFSLSFRDIELLLVERGVIVSYESVRRWCLRFGVAFVGKLRRRRSRPGDKWHLDEVFLRIRGKLHYLWRAVDQDGIVLDILVQSHSNAATSADSGRNSAVAWTKGMAGLFGAMASITRCGTSVLSQRLNTVRYRNVLWVLVAISVLKHTLRQNRIFC